MTLLCSMNLFAGPTFRLYPRQAACSTQLFFSDCFQDTPSPFSFSSYEELQRQYAVTVDAKNAIILRQSAILVDIGHCLEVLRPKINLYAMDTVMLASAHADLEYIHSECLSQKIHLNFCDLEWHRSAQSPNGLAFVDDKRHPTFRWKERIITFGDHHEAEKAAGLQFLKDPAALIEGRLPRLGFQR